MILQKYSDPNRPKGECYDCGKKYGGVGWVDVSIPDEIWKKINPTDYKGGGLLCFNCIAKRCQLLGLSNVPIALKSGPFVING